MTCYSKKKAAKAIAFKAGASEFFFHRNRQAGPRCMCGEAALHLSQVREHAPLGNSLVDSKIEVSAFSSCPFMTAASQDIFSQPVETANSCFETFRAQSVAEDVP